MSLTGSGWPITTGLPRQHRRKTSCSPLLRKVDNKIPVLLTVIAWFQKQNGVTHTDAEEAATWLMDVGLEKIVDILMESNQQLTEASLAATVLEEGFTINQLKTVKQRVNTIRFTQKGRKNRLGTGHQRPDCRDIFRDPEVKLI